MIVILSEKAQAKVQLMILLLKVNVFILKLKKMQISTEDLGMSARSWSGLGLFSTLNKT